jgi:hypothetical protein
MTTDRDHRISEEHHEIAGGRIAEAARHAEPATATEHQPATPAEALRWAAARITARLAVADVTDHAAAALLAVWARDLDAAPRRYELPAEPPGPVWDRHGCKWKRDIAPGHWRLAVMAACPDGRVWHLSEPCIEPWRALFAEHEPLSTTPPTTTEQG